MDLTMTEARDRLTRLPEELADKHNTEAVTITRHGQPVLAVLPWELYEALLETLEIASDPEAMAALRQSLTELRSGQTIPWEQVKAELGL